MTGARPGGVGDQRLILASKSATRAALLERAGVPAEAIAASVDEDEIKRSMKGEGVAAGAVAMTLAETKASRVSRQNPHALVIGADQMLVAGDDWFDKPADRAAAKRQLQALRGRSHRLISAACIVHDGGRIWGCVEEATLVMRPFSDAFLDRYLDLVGDGALRSVGAYQLEGLGAQLLDRIDGDYFVILGLPLLPLLAFLRSRGIVPA